MLEGELERELERQLATLALSHVRPSGSAEAVQAVGWWNALSRLGLRPPLVVVHDLGLVLARAAERVRPQVVHLTGSPAALGRYEALLAAVTASDVVESVSGAHLRDETLAIVLARVIGDIYNRWSGRPRPGMIGGELPLISTLYDADRGALSRGVDPGWAMPFLQLLADHHAAVVARVEQIDTGPLRLLGLFAVDAATGPRDLADLYQMVTTVGAADVVDFSLELLPSLLETKRRRAVQRFAIDGYASVERRGNFDSILPVELAQDPEIFEHKALHDDFLFYGHERQREGGRKLHYVLVDSSASMRGVRQVFARGLALALVKKFSLLGSEVWLRFFDSRLHERVEVGARGSRELPYLLCFRSERGRNYARVFSQLEGEIARLRRDEGRDIAITFVTHAECHIPTATVESLARDAHLYGIFVLPSKPISLEYLPILHRHQVVTAESLSRALEKRRRALEIIEDVAVRVAP